MTREELRDYVEEQRTLNNIPYHVYSELIDGIDTLEQEPTTKNDLGVDCISRAQVQTEIEMNACRYTIAKERGGMGQVEWSDQLIKVSDAVGIIRNLPSVTPQEPKTGHWIPSHIPESILDECSECGFSCGAFTFNYCPNCGARMVEPQESEENNGN